MYAGSCSWKNSVRIGLSMLYAQQVSAVAAPIVPAMTSRARQNSPLLVPPIPYMRCGTTICQKFFAAVR